MIQANNVREQRVKDCARAYGGIVACLDGLPHGSRDAGDEECKLSTLTLVKYAGERLFFVVRMLLVPFMGGPRHVLEHVGGLFGPSVLKISNDFKVWSLTDPRPYHWVLSI